MKREWYWIAGFLTCVAIIWGALLIWAPREMAQVYTDGSISAFGYIENLAPGMKLSTQLKVENSSWIEGGTVSIHFARPASNYEQTVKYIGDKEVSIGAIIYVPAPANAGEWITLQENEVFLKPRERKTIYLHIDTPKDAEFPPHWQFLLVAKNEDQGGQFVQTQNVCRCLVTMRQ